MALLEVSDLVKDYGGRRVVDGISLEVDSREIVGLLGPNGAGKTTTFRSVLGLVRPDEGTIRFQGEDISTLPVYKRARVGIGYLAQEPSVFRGLSVHENLLAVLEWIPGLSKRQQGTRAEDLMERFHLGARRDHKASQLSGGEKRRLEIARVLAREPALLLLDEPFANIDPRTVEELHGILVELRRQGIGILVTDHNVRETLAITDRSFIIVDGRILRHGAARELVEDPLVRRAYLGERFSMHEIPPPSAVSETATPARDANAEPRSDVRRPNTEAKMLQDPLKKASDTRPT